MKLRDVIQAFVEACRKIGRLIFVRPNKVLRYPPELLFRVEVPLHGLPESCVHWFHTYIGYHKADLKMQQLI